jgi:hypothetical protein
MEQVSVGVIGSGFVAELNMHAYRRVYGLDVTLRAVVSRGDHVADVAKRFGIPKTYPDYRELLADDASDICTQPTLCHISAYEDPRGVMALTGDGSITHPQLRTTEDHALVNGNGPSGNR